MLTGEENQENCLNHHLHAIIERALGKPGTVGLAIEASKDFNLISSVVAYIRSRSTLIRKLTVIELAFHEDVAVIAENATRWEGIFRALERFVRLREPICQLSREQKQEFMALYQDLASTTRGPYV